MNIADYDLLVNYNTPPRANRHQMLVAVLCGGAIGLERELSRKPAGLRTNVLICIGATLLMIPPAHRRGCAVYRSGAPRGAGRNRHRLHRAGVIMQSRGQ